MTQFRKLGAICILWILFHAVTWADSVGTTSGTFAVSPSGGAQYSIPVTVPPGAGGIAPQLSIQFDASSGDGYMDPRLALAGLSQISHCPANVPHDGFFDAVEFDKKDRFSLDGRHGVSTACGHRLIWVISSPSSLNKRGVQI
jgi:hypothetical protein